MIAMLEREIGPLEAIPDQDSRAPATEYRFTDGIGRVGFVASVSQPVLPELQPPAPDRGRQVPLLPVRDRGNRRARPAAPAARPTKKSRKPSRSCVSDKWIGHQINTTQFVPPPRPMYSIGG